jgi:hypothetical protein
MVTGSSSGSPITGRALTGAVDLGEDSGMVVSAREPAYQCDGKVGQRLGLGLVFAKIPHEGSPIYRGFDTHA